jgi:hypothetical protein
MPPHLTRLDDAADQKTEIRVLLQPVLHPLSQRAKLVAAKAHLLHDFHSLRVGGDSQNGKYFSSSSSPLID